MMESRCAAAASILLRRSICRGLDAAARIRWVSPMIAFMGVRISWLMLARKALLARLALSARARLGQLRGALRDQHLQMVAVPIEFLLDAFFLGDVLLGGQVVGDGAARAAYRGDLGKLHILAAVLAAIVELALPGPPVGEGIPKRGEGGLGGLARMENPRVAPQYLLARVTRGAHEGLVDILDTGAEVGDDDAFGTLLDGQRQLAKLLFGLATLADVQPGDHGAQYLLSLDAMHRSLRRHRLPRCPPLQPRCALWSPESPPRGACHRGSGRQSPGRMRRGSARP